MDLAFGLDLAVKLGAVDNSSSEALRPATCSRDPEILLNAQHYCTEIDRSGSRGQAAGRRPPRDEMSTDPTINLVLQLLD